VDVLRVWAQRCGICARSKGHQDIDILLPQGFENGREEWKLVRRIVEHRAEGGVHERTHGAELTEGGRKELASGCVETGEAISDAVDQAVELDPGQARGVEGTKRRRTLPVLLKPQKETPWLNRITPQHRSGSHRCELRRDELAQWLHGRGQDPAAETLFRDWDDLATFYDYPAEHWIHLRTSNPVESVFAGVRLRTNVSKQMRRRDSALYLVFKITQRLELGWRPLNGGLTLMTLLLRGDRFVDGIYIPTDVERPDVPGKEVSVA